jgi:type IV secretory pathway VirJ component
VIGPLRAPIAVVVIVLSLVFGARRAGASERVDLPVRGKTIALTIYQPDLPAAQVKGTVFMGSGDVGWVGLAVSMAEFLRDNGYLVVGINVRQYLSAFRIGDQHLMVADVQGDFDRIAAYLRRRSLLRPPVVLSGVSEGAAIAVLGASALANHSWIDGVITMGLPATAELAWRWSDFTSWITKKDSAEPSFASRDYIAAVSPKPLWMIQSTTDEYVTTADYRDLEAAARPPRTLVLIQASNHRFTDRIKELRQAYLAALQEIRK